MLVYVDPLSFLRIARDSTNGLAHGYDRLREQRRRRGARE
jgi:hypothetical protein